MPFLTYYTAPEDILQNNVVKNGSYTVASIIFMKLSVVKGLISTWLYVSEHFQVDIWEFDRTCLTVTYISNSDLYWELQFVIWNCDANLTVIQEKGADWRCDCSSVHNNIIMTNGGKWSKVIHTTSQASRWKKYCEVLTLSPVHDTQWKTGRDSAT